MMDRTNLDIISQLIASMADSLLRLEKANKQSDIKDIELAKKEMKKLKGKQVMEFTITSRCARYEL